MHSSLRLPALGPGTLGAQLLHMAGTAAKGVAEPNCGARFTVITDYQTPYAVVLKLEMLHPPFPYHPVSDKCDQADSEYCHHRH